MKWIRCLFLFLGTSLPLFAQDAEFVKEQIEQGYKYYEERDYHSSLLSFDRALEHEPWNYEALLGKLNVQVELGNDFHVESIIRKIWLVLGGRKENMLPVLRAQAVRYIKTYDYDSALYWLDILEQQDNKGSYAEEISEYRKQIRDKKLVLEDIVIRHDYSFLEEKPPFHPQAQFSYLIKTLLPSKCYELPFFNESTTRVLASSLSMVERWEILEGRLVVIAGHAYRSGITRALLLFDMKEKQGAVLSWHVGHGLYIFSKDKEFLNTDMHKDIVNDWVARVDMLHGGSEPASSPTINYIFEFSE